MDTFLRILSSITDVLRAADLLPDFSSARGIFCAIAWIATLLTLGSMVLSFFMDFGGDADVDVPSDTPDGATGAVSVRAIIGFLLGLGWGGYIAVQMGCGVLPSIIAGLALGLLLFFIIAGLMRLIYGLKSDGSLNYAELEGATGTVYVTIPPHGEPGGQVQVSHPSRLVTMAAVQFGDSPLPSQTRIVVVQASTTCLTVRPLTPTNF